jgi:quercetin dioxygenase-like cupin family protein
MFVKSKDAQSVKLDGSTSRKILARGGSLMTVEVEFEKGGVGELHSHPHEQISYVIQGSFLYIIEDSEKILIPGDSCYIPSGALHGVTALQDGKLVDVFTPQREDFLK